MLNAPETRLDWKDVREELPAPGTIVLLRTASYQFAGYLDENQVWHWLNGGIEPNAVYCWLGPVRS